MLQRQLERPEPEGDAVVVETRELEVPKQAQAEAPPKERCIGQICCCCLGPGCCIGPIIAIELGANGNLDDALAHVWKRIHADRSYVQRFQEMARAGLIKLE